MSRGVRTVPELVLSEQLALARWLGGSEGRRSSYFELVDSAQESLSKIAGHPPPDELLVLVLAIAVANDQSLLTHVLEYGAGSLISDPVQWERVCRAAAATVLESYLDAVDKTEWP